MMPGGIEGLQQRIDVVGIDALDEPAEGFELRRERLEIEDLRRGTIGLHDVNDADQVVELVTSGRHRGFLGRALVELAVGEQVVDERFRASALQPEARPDGNAKTMAERAASDLHSRV